VYAIIRLTIVHQPICHSSLINLVWASITFGCPPK